MITKKFNHLKTIKRIRVSEGRDLIKGLRLDRNERVEDWDHKFSKKLFSSIPTYLLSTYPDLSKLYKKLSKFHKIIKDNILVTSGIDGGIRTIFELCLEPKDKICCVTPTYAMYDVYSKIYKIKNLKISFNQNYKLKIKDLDKYLKQNIKVFFLPNPNQPIESCFNINELKTIALKTQKAKCLFVIDEAYHLFGSKSAISLVTTVPAPISA